MIFTIKNRNFCFVYRLLFIISCYSKSGLAAKTTTSLFLWIFLSIFINKILFCTGRKIEHFFTSHIIYIFWILYIINYWIILLNIYSIFICVNHWIYLMKHSSLNLNKFSDYIREHGIDAAMAKYHMSRNTVKKFVKIMIFQFQKKVGL